MEGIFMLFRRFFSFLIISILTCSKVFLSLGMETDLENNLCDETFKQKKCYHDELLAEIKQALEDENYNKEKHKISEDQYPHIGYIANLLIEHIQKNKNIILSSQVFAYPQKTLHAYVWLVAKIASEINLKYPDKSFTINSVSLASGELPFEYLLIYALSGLGYKQINIHAVDPIYTTTAFAEDLRKLLLKTSDIDIQLFDIGKNLNISSNKNNLMSLCSWTSLDQVYSWWKTQSLETKVIHSYNMINYNTVIIGNDDLEARLINGKRPLVTDFNFLNIKDAGTLYLSFDQSQSFICTFEQNDKKELQELKDISADNISLNLIARIETGSFNNISLLTELKEKFGYINPGVNIEILFLDFIKNTSASDKPIAYVFVAGSKESYIQDFGKLYSTPLYKIINCQYSELHEDIPEDYLGPITEEDEIIIKGRLFAYDKNTKQFILVE